MESLPSGCILREVVRLFRINDRLIFRTRPVFPAGLFFYNNKYVFYVNRINAEYVCPYANPKTIDNIHDQFVYPVPERSELIVIVSFGYRVIKDNQKN